MFNRLDVYPIHFIAVETFSLIHLSEIGLAILIEEKTDLH
jgi:hypothetical protein